MVCMPRRPQKPAGNHPIDDHKEMGLRAVEHLQAVVRQIYDNIDTQDWRPSEKLAHFHQVLGVFGSWFLAPMSPETCAQFIGNMAKAAERAPFRSAPRAFH
jgi:hypothetical protein